MTWLYEWEEASSAFRSLAERHGDVERIAHGGRGPGGEELTVDVALLGPANAKRCVIVSSGLHGVEGVAGSAIQRQWLEQGADSSTRVVLIHLLNPFGFAWQRRVDAENIDLNRNFLLEGEEFTGTPPGWSDVVPWLLPGRPASRWDPLLPKALLGVARMGRKAVFQAISGGQYETPQGLFYGGSGPATLQELLRDGLPRWTKGAREVLHLDIHTGLGASGELQLLLPRRQGTPEGDALVARFGPDAKPALDTVRHYRVRGGLGNWCEALLPDSAYTLCAAEFGTVSALEVVAALHQENRAWFWGQRDDQQSAWARTRLAHAFAPVSPAWRQRVVDRGVHLINQATEPR
ncbi:M14 family metallopeptidase [Streptomyces sp. NBC_01276]|uniref:M14 family metallopeptidase n=1 Tax=Streptomyces sp. NBC_01276 TaxID=2903808 RepID=UPI00352E94D0